MPTVALEPTISVGERPQTYALDRAATGTVWYAGAYAPAYQTVIYTVTYKICRNDAVNSPDDGKMAVRNM